VERNCEHWLLANALILYAKLPERAVFVVLKEINMKVLNVKNDEFYKCHPMVNFIYFVCVIGLTMFFWHPVFLVISLIASIVYLRLYRVNLHLPYMIGMMIFIIIFNVLVNHQGITTLFYMFYGNPITLESLIYGVSASLMLVSIIFWFLCYMQIVTSDKFIYLFSKISKKMSLFFSMILRFIPLLMGRLKEVYSVQKLMYVDRFGKVRLAVNSFFITTSWAIENAIVTSDSMKARGYGLNNRTNFNNYKFDRRDAVILLIILLLLLGTIVLLRGEAFYIRYFPGIKINTSFLGIVISSMLLFLPEIINLYYRND